MMKGQVEEKTTAAAVGLESFAALTSKVMAAAIGVGACNVCMVEEDAGCVEGDGEKRRQRLDRGSKTRTEEASFV